MYIVVFALIATAAYYFTHQKPAPAKAVETTTEKKELTEEEKQEMEKHRNENLQKLQCPGGFAK